MLLVSAWCLCKYSLTKHLYFPVTAGLLFYHPDFESMTDIIPLESGLELKYDRSLIKIFVE